MSNVLEALFYNLEQSQSQNQNRTRLLIIFREIIMLYYSLVSEEDSEPHCKCVVHEKYLFEILAWFISESVYVDLTVSRSRSDSLNVAFHLIDDHNDLNAFSRMPDSLSKNYKKNSG